jgi:shikimate dehydrogenase
MSKNDLRAKLFASTGKPILHSRSPQMHNAGFKSVGERAVYFRLAARDAADAFSSARKMGLSGLSVTAPFKEGMRWLVKPLSSEAKKIGAVNTVIFRNGKTSGHNTDWIGVAESLRENGVAMQGRRALVIGAGGAAEAAAFALLKNGAQVAIANRTVGKASKLASKFGCAYCSLEASKLKGALAGCSIIVSTVSTAERLIPPSLIRPGMAILDALYAKPTAIMRDARKKGCRAISGEKWLLHQGAGQFRLFIGKAPPVAAMRRGLAAAKSPRKRSIALIGFMGTGKTEVGKLAAKISGRRFVDLDSEIEKAAGASISEIFAKKGEAHFRKLETAQVRKFSRAKSGIISCGGGVILRRENVTSLRRNSLLVWLFTSEGEILRRVGKDSSRPLLKVKDRAGKIHSLLSQRTPLYAASCDFAICTDGKKPQEIARMILDEIH